MVSISDEDSGMNSPEEQDPSAELIGAVTESDLQKVRELLSHYPDVLWMGGNGRDCLKYAASEGDLPMMELLVEAGVDINSPANPRCPEGPIYEASSTGTPESVRWLIEHGARINFEVDGTLRCLPLVSAVRENKLEIVKILVDAGAALNSVWNNDNALSFAIKYNRKSIESYLRLMGLYCPIPKRRNLVKIAPLPQIIIGNTTGKFNLSLFVDFCNLNRGLLSVL